MPDLAAQPASPRPRSFVRRLLRSAVLFAVWSFLLLLTVWAAAALYFDVPRPGLRTSAAVAYLFLIVAAVIFLRKHLRAMLFVLSAFAIVLIWWLNLEPSQNRPWQPDVAKAPWAEVRGDEVTLHNVRNCDYVSETNYQARWETRTVRLSNLTGIDIALTYWGSPWMAHPVVSFQFSDAPPVAFSIETRKEIGESYSAIRGFFRQFELAYIVADERDVIRLRTNYRQGEDVYLYRTAATPEQARGRFMEYIERVNALHKKPMWYNALTANCTTSIRTQRTAERRAPFDWRMILNGKSDEMLYERKGMVGTNLPFPELKQKSHINPRANAADKSADFSKAIRAGMPW